MKPPAGSTTTKRCDVCGEPATREFCYAAEPWVPYCGLHYPQYATVGERQLKAVEPTPEPPRCDCLICASGRYVMSAKGASGLDAVEPAPPTPAPCVWTETAHKQDAWDFCPFCGVALKHTR